ncbi:MAG TPA: NADPH-dependent FMN reductase [Gammaproteobacteria bacterium]|nr:NADPH-dependent FMN reductase [Gammaproteobacteria bacterium]
MINIIGISGSLRKGSYNTALLKEAAEIGKGEIQIASIDEIPLYNGDVEAKSIPQSVLELQQKFKRADGILIASPEYNNGVPGVLKNTIDWLSRPATIIPEIFGGKPLAMMGASLSGFGTILSQTAWLQTWRLLHVNLWNEKMPFMVSRANTALDAEGRITDAKIRQNLQEYIEGFIAFVYAQTALNRSEEVQRLRSKP